MIELRFRGNPVGLWGLLDELKAERLDVRFTPPPEQPDGMNWRVDVTLVVVEDPAAGATATSDADLTTAAERALQRWRTRHPQQDATIADAH